MIRAALAVGAALGVTVCGAHAQTFGALAYSPETGAWGTAYNFQSRGAAEDRALAECGRNSHGCRPAIWFRDACGAIATTSDGGWGSGWGGTVALAEREAVNSCKQHGNQGCTIVTTLCSSQ